MDELEGLEAKLSMLVYGLGSVIIVVICTTLYMLGLSQ